MIRRVLAFVIPGVMIATAASAQTADPATWMHDLKSQIGHIPLNRLAIPGTHDSGTASLDPNSDQAPDSFAYAIEKPADDWFNGWDSTGAVAFVFNKILNGILNPIIYKWAVAQDKSIYDQLNGGIRYFDIRLCPGPGTKISICHSLYGDDVGNVLFAVKLFMNGLDNPIFPLPPHPDEIVVLDFSHLPSHGITGSLSVTLAEEIRASLGDLLISRSVSPGAPLEDILNSQSGRVIALYDDPDIDANDPSTAGLLWPGQNLDGARVFTPWPAVNNPTDEKAAAFTYLQNRSGYSGPDEGTPYTDGSDKLFVIQTNPTPDGESFARGAATSAVPYLIGGFIGGSVIADVKNNIDKYFDSCLGAQIAAFGLDVCGALDDIANSLGWVVGPQDLKALAYQANLAFFGTSPTVTDWVTANDGALRDNLNIVQADMFERRLTSGFPPQLVPNDFVSSMVKLNLAPEGTLAISSGPSYAPDPYQPFVRSDTRFSIVPTNPSVWGLGVTFGSYQVDPPSSLTYLSPLVPYSGPFAISGYDGEHAIYSRVKNAAGVKSRLNFQKIVLDNTPPAITVTETTPDSYDLHGIPTYNHDHPFTLNWSITDDVAQGAKGSGVRSVGQATIDGSPILTDVITGHQKVLSNNLSNGAGANTVTINLLTELPLGYHTFAYGGAVDNVGNQANPTPVTFKVVSTLNSITADLDQFIADGGISDQPWAELLRRKMDAAALARSQGRYGVAASIYRSIIDDLLAHGGNASSIASNIITEDAEYLMCMLPTAQSTPTILARTNPVLLSRNDELFRLNGPTPLCQAFSR